MSLFSAKVHVLPDGDILEIDNGGEIRVPTVIETTSVTLKNFGISILDTSSDKKTFVLDTPAPGVVKTLIRPASGSTNPCVYSGGTAVLFTSSAASNYITFTSGIGAGARSALVHMVGLTTARWGILFKTSSIIIEDSNTGT